MTVEGHGMPFYNETSSSFFTGGQDVPDKPLGYGNLFILFKVKFPDTIELDQVDQIKKQLRDLDGMVTMSFEEMKQELDCESLVRYNVQQKNTNPEGGHHALDEFDDYDIVDRIKDQCNIQ